MIIEEKIEVSARKDINPYYLDKGYSIELNRNNKKIFLVKPLDLPYHSNYFITAVCDICGKEKDKRIKFCDYYKSYNKHKSYACSKKCSIENTKKTNLEKYGTENVFQVDEFKEKTKITNLEKYGVEHHLQNKEIFEKVKQTNLERYGVEHPIQNDEIKEKTKKTNLEKYEVEYPTQSDKVKEKYKETCLERYSVDNVSKLDSTKEKVKLSNLERYGTEYYTQTDEYKEKVKQTNIELYGREYYLQTEEFQEKVKQTSLKRYGTEHHSQSDIVKDKKIKNNLERYGVEHVLQIEEIRNKTILKQRTKTIKQYQTMLSNDFKIIDYTDTVFLINDINKNHFFEINRYSLYNRIKKNLNVCNICNPIQEDSSLIETDIRNWIEDNYKGIITKDKSILNGKHLDIYLPDLNLAIEFNGLYWHSEYKVDKDYHLNKTIGCNNKGIDLIHIFEDDWLNKKDIIKSILLNRIGIKTNTIYSRKCIIKEVDSKETRTFLDENHIQGFSKSTYKLGLYYESELVSIMTFGYRKTNSKKEFELIRFCNKINTHIPGSASKLFKHFLNNYTIETDYILSYADISMFSGSLYDTLGFKEIHLTEPNYFWVVNNKREHRWKYNKQNLIKDGFDSTLTEKEIMYSRGYFRIFGCGQKRYEYYIE